MREKIRVGCIQTEILENNQSNLIQIKNFFEQMTSQNPEIICLPERWWYYEISNLTKEKLSKDFAKQYSFIQNLAIEYQTPIISGGLWHFDEKENKYFISAYYFSKQGEELIRQDKIHLYGREQDFFTPGKQLYIIHDKNLELTFSILICFDLNISFYLPRKAAKEGAEILFSPVMIRSDGMTNWNTYIQARALENRIPIVTCNPIAHYNRHRFIGQSKIIQFEDGKSSPSSLKIYSATAKPQMIIEDINIEFPNKIRAQRLNENRPPSQIKIEYLNV